MRPLYIIPDSCSSLLSDNSREGGVYYPGGRNLPEDINVRVYCNLACRFLSEGYSWEAVLLSLDIPHNADLMTPFISYTSMTPDEYRLWCRSR